MSLWLTYKSSSLGVTSTKSYWKYMLSTIKVVKFLNFLVEMVDFIGKSEGFESTRKSMQAFVLLPGLVSLGFNVLSPFSIFRSIAIYSSIGASLGSFFYSLKEELHDHGRDDMGPIGTEVRYRFSQLSAFDGL